MRDIDAPAMACVRLSGDTGLWRPDIHIRRLLAMFNATWYTDTTVVISDRQLCVSKQGFATSSRPPPVFD